MFNGLISLHGAAVFIHFISLYIGYSSTFRLFFPNVSFSRFTYLHSGRKFTLSRRRDLSPASLPTTSHLVAALQLVDFHTTGLFVYTWVGLLLNPAQKCNLLQLLVVVYVAAMCSETLRSCEFSAGKKFWVVVLQRFSQYEGTVSLRWKNTSTLEHVTAITKQFVRLHSSVMTIRLCDLCACILNSSPSSAFL